MVSFVSASTHLLLLVVLPQEPHLPLPPVCLQERDSVPVRSDHLASGRHEQRCWDTDALQGKKSEVSVGRDGAFAFAVDVERQGNGSRDERAEVSGNEPDGNVQPAAVFFGKRDHG